MQNQDNIDNIENIDENANENTGVIETPEINHWEELDKNNAVVKKYIVYIAKDFVPVIDKMTTDEKSAYINDAIQKKIDLEDEKKQKAAKNRLKLHLAISVLTILFMTPVALLAVNKAIMLTFENYKYSQENFEKLYKQHFEKDKAFMRSLQYNKEQERKMKQKLQNVSK